MLQKVETIVSHNRLLVAVLVSRTIGPTLQIYELAQAL